MLFDLYICMSPGSKQLLHHSLIGNYFMRTRYYSGSRMVIFDCQKYGFHRVLTY